MNPSLGNNPPPERTHRDAYLLAHPPWPKNWPCDLIWGLGVCNLWWSSHGNVASFEGRATANSNTKRAPHKSPPGIQLQQNAGAALPMWDHRVGAQAAVAWPLASSFRNIVHSNPGTPLSSSGPCPKKHQRDHPACVARWQHGALRKKAGGSSKPQTAKSGTSSHSPFSRQLCHLRPSSLGTMMASGRLLSAKTLPQFGSVCAVCLDGSF